KYPRMENLRLPVRFEVGAVTISPGQFLALTPGQVLHVDGGGMMQAKMTVCGSIFAEGKIERFEDFYGFRIERLC
ncbi:MAG: FliM/FliN family flagellar motor C-terminal domain-containing protein, partial [Candidatus Omnitrophota bacterium]